MELRHIKAFLTVAEELHFGRAAARLRVAQPAVSQLIRALEEELGVSLFTRSQRRVELTAAGAFFREDAERAVLSVERAATAARRASVGEVGRLRLSFTATSTLSIGPQAIAAFRRRYPDVQVSAENLGTSAQIEAIRAGRCDVGFTALPMTGCPLRAEAVSQAPLMVFLPEGHRLAKQRLVRVADLAGEPVILPSRALEADLHGMYHRLCEGAGFAPNIAFEVDHTDVILSFVAAGLGISHGPSSILKLRFPGVTARPLSPKIVSTVSVMWDPARPSPTVERFLEVVREEKKRGERLPA